MEKGRQEQLSKTLRKCARARCQPNFNVHNYEKKIVRIYMRIHIPAAQTAMGRKLHYMT